MASLGRCLGTHSRRWLLLALATCVVLVPAKQSFQVASDGRSGPDMMDDMSASAKDDIAHSAAVRMTITDSAASQLLRVDTKKESEEAIKEEHAGEVQASSQGQTKYLRQEASTAAAARPPPRGICRGELLPTKCPNEQQAEEDGLTAAAAAGLAEEEDPCEALTELPETLPGQGSIAFFAREAILQGCDGYHRCSRQSKGFRQCQFKPGSTKDCHTGANCLPPCLGSKLGEDGQDCSAQSVDDCHGNHVVRKGMGIQCTIKFAGNPSGADFCEDDHLCGIVPP